MPTAKLSLAPLFVFAAACATDAPTVELVNSAGKNDEIYLTLSIDNEDTIDVTLNCEFEQGCDIALSVGDENSEPFDGTIDLTLIRPDGFSRTDSLDDANGQGGVSTAFFGQEPGYYTITIANNSGADMRAQVSGQWIEARADIGAAVGAPCATPDNCAAGQACLGASEGQTGFCSSECTILGDLVCGEVGALCALVDETTGQAFCFNTCDAELADCGGDHLECVAGDGSSLGVCTISAAAENPADGQ